MFSSSDTIVAIATPPGRGGIGVVRLSGPRAHEIVRALIARDEPLRERHATFATLTSPPDQVIVTFFPAPHSYTGDDVVEVSAHGSPVVLSGIVDAATKRGARLAAPGEFTLRAFVNERIDLMQAEAVGDLIDAVTPLQARAAFDQLNGTLTNAIREIDAALFDLVAKLEASVDFPEEGYHFVERAAVGAELDGVIARLDALLIDAARGRLVRDGLQVAIVGAPNAGKSTLFNALLGTARAIVTDVPGTTRDLVTEVLDLDGLRVTLVDTAGLRETSDPVESQAVSRAHGAAAVADLVLIVRDGSVPLEPERDKILQITDNKRLTVKTKSDLPSQWQAGDAVAVSAATGDGLRELRARMVSALGVNDLSETPAVTNIRHARLLERARAALARAHQAAASEAMSEEFVLADLQDAREALEEISGRRTTDDLLVHIFSRFCIGK